jgi:hypothetical protein
LVSDQDAYTGKRIGYIVAPRTLAFAIKTFQDSAANVAGLFDFKLAGFE